MAVALAATAVGCAAATTASSTTPGKAWVVSGHAFGTNVYNCEAGQPPTCYRVVERKVTP